MLWFFFICYLFLQRLHSAFTQHMNTHEHFLRRSKGRYTYHSLQGYFFSHNLCELDSTYLWIKTDDCLARSDIMFSKCDEPWLSHPSQKNIPGTWHTWILLHAHTPRFSLARMIKCAFYLAQFLIFVILVCFIAKGFISCKWSHVKLTWITEQKASISSYLYQSFKKKNLHITFQKILSDFCFIITTCLLVPNDFTGMFK